MSEVLSQEWQNCLVSAVIHSADLAYRVMCEEATMPHVLLRPKLSIDGNQWRALYGEDLQDGLAGFGDSPQKAMQAFDLAYYASLPK